MERGYWRSSITVAMLLSASPSLLAGQQLGFLDKVFGNVTNIDAAFIFGSPIGSKGFLTDSGGLRGVNVEVTIDLGRIAKIRGCRARREADSTLTEIRVQKGGGHEDTVQVYSVSKHKKPSRCDAIDAELGFGYSQLTGFRADTLGLQGAIEELPAVSFYLNFYPEHLFSPYVGVRTGLTQLKGFRATVADSLLTGSGSTFEYGGVLGLAFSPSDQWALFAEASFTYRNFDGVSWTGSKVTIPPALQATLRPSTRTIAIGGEISIGPQSSGSGSPQ